MDTCMPTCPNLKTWTTLYSIIALLKGLRDVSREKLNDWTFARCHSAPCKNSKSRVSAQCDAEACTHRGSEFTNLVSRRSNTDRNHRSRDLDRSLQIADRSFEIAVQIAAFRTRVTQQIAVWRSRDLWRSLCRTPPDRAISLPNLHLKTTISTFC